MPKFSKFEPIDITGIDATKEITEKLPRLIDSVTKIVTECMPEGIRNPCVVYDRSKRREGSDYLKEAISIFNKIASNYDRFDPGNKTVNTSLRRLLGALKANPDYGDKYADKLWFSTQDVSVKELVNGLIAVVKRANSLYY